MIFFFLFLHFFNLNFFSSVFPLAYLFHFLSPIFSYLECFLKGAILSINDCIYYIHHMVMDSVQDLLDVTPNPAEHSRDFSPRSGTSSCEHCLPSHQTC